MSETSKPLGRRIPTDFEHVSKYPLRLAAQPEVIGQPLCFGINWYQNFDHPEEVWIEGHKTFWIGRAANWGSIRGGHCICAKPVGLADTMGWYQWYNQGNEGACVGYGESRMMSLYNRKRFDAAALYHEAQKVDEWPGEDYEGTSLRAGFDVLRSKGHKRAWGPFSLPWDAKWGISANRWLTNVDDILLILGTSNVYGGAVPLLNSWGKAFPRLVWLPAEAVSRLLAEDGECGAVTDL
jgi:hypothetical protein